MRYAAAVIAAWVVLGGVCFAQSADPYVQLDAAKLELGRGELEQAQELLAAIPEQAGAADIDEESAFQQLLLSAAFLQSAHYLGLELTRHGFAESDFATWVRGEQARQLAAFSQHAARYLALTESGAALDFVRFRLPHISDEHLQDAGLLAEQPLLEAATNNWAEGRENLGQGLLLSQARIALVLSAAIYYDLPEGAPSLDRAVDRLRSGVPLPQDTMLNWLAEKAALLGGSDDGARLIAAVARERVGLAPVAEIAAVVPEAVPAAPAAPPAKSKHEFGKNRSKLKFKPLGEPVKNNAEEEPSE